MIITQQNIQFPTLTFAMDRLLTAASARALKEPAPECRDHQITGGFNPANRLLADFVAAAKDPPPPTPKKSPTSNAEPRWEDHFKEMVAYKKKHGDCFVPLNSEDYPDLAQWVKRQRYQYMRRTRGETSSMSERRFSLLEGIGFIWQAQDASWGQRYHELAEFQKANGHCKVPTRYPPNKALGAWVKCQRTQYRKFQRKGQSNMTEERFRKLEELGFTWEGR